MSERTLHRAVCQYLKMAYPNVIFNTDLSGAGKLTIGQATTLKALRSGRGFPDLVIYESCKGFHGLFIELKQDLTKVFTNAGNCATPHIAEQWKMIQRLQERGYSASFAVGFSEAKLIIDNYLK